VVTAGQNGSVRGWDINTGRKILEIDNRAPVNDVAFDPENPGVVATAGDDGAVRLWRLASGKLIATSQADDGFLPVYAMAFSPDSRLLATAHSNGRVKLWKVSDLFSAASKPFKTLDTQEAPHPARVLAFSPDSQSLAIGIDVDVLLCRTSTESLKIHDGLVCLTPDVERAGPVRALTFSPGLDVEGLTGGDKLLVAADNASIRLLDVPGRALRSIYTGPTGNVLSVAFGPDSKTIAAAGSDNTIGLWEVQAGPEDETGDGSPLRRSTENPEPDDVIDWVCRYHPTPALPRWPESISAEFRRDICPGNGG
jgi:WD40 repeat protein